MNNNKVLFAVAAFMLGLSVTSAEATGWPVYDSLRAAKFAGQGVERLLGYISEYQKVSADQSGLEIVEGKKDIDKQPAAQTYSYLEKAQPFNMDQESMCGGVPKFETVAEAESYVKKEYFTKQSTIETVGGQKKCKNPATEEEIKKTDLKRHQYVEDVYKEILSLSDGIRKNAAAELSQLKEAPVAAAGEVQQIELLAQMKKTMVEQKAADIILQSKLMVLDALNMLSGQELQLIDDPASGEICVNGYVVKVGGV